MRVPKTQFFNLVPNYYTGELVNKFLQSVGGFDIEKARLEILKVDHLHILPYSNEETVPIGKDRYSGRSATLDMEIIERMTVDFLDIEPWPRIIKYFDPDMGVCYVIHDGHHRLASAKKLKHYYVAVEVWDITDALKQFIKNT